MYGLAIAFAVPWPHENIARGRGIALPVNPEERNRDIRQCAVKKQIKVGRLQNRPMTRATWTKPRWLRFAPRVARRKAVAPNE